MKTTFDLSKTAYVTCTSTPVYTESTQHIADLIVKRKKKLRIKIVWHCDTLETNEFEEILRLVKEKGSHHLSKDEIIELSKVAKH